jgi:hypothetical protein
MLDENIWSRLSEAEKFIELRAYLNQLIDIEEGRHELSRTVEQGRLVEIKKEIHEKIYKIIELENAL